MFQQVVFTPYMTFHHCIDVAYASQMSVYLEAMKQMKQKVSENENKAFSAVFRLHDE